MHTTVVWDLTPCSLVLWIARETYTKKWMGSGCSCRAGERITHCNCGPDVSRYLSGLGQILGTFCSRIMISKRFGRTCYLQHECRMVSHNGKNGQVYPEWRIGTGSKREPELPFPLRLFLCREDGARKAFRKVDICQIVPRHIQEQSDLIVTSSEI